MTHPATVRPESATAPPGAADGDAVPVAKRVLDVAGASALLLATAPLLLAALILVRATSPGPAFFRLVAVGRRGRTFRMLKLRTMVPDAEARLAEVIGGNRGTGPMLKVAADPRITPVGRWLRRLSIDELPQLVNVLRGEMSLVGPRPISAALYDPRYLEGRWRRRLEVLPGMTGLWQVTGRSQDFEECCRLDEEYVARWSPWLDVTLLARTIPAVLRGHGAA